LLTAARLYDPSVRRWPGRLVFSNGVLLFGPRSIPSPVAAEPGFPNEMTVGWYARSAAQRSSSRRSHDAKQFDGERLVRGLAGRLGGVTHPGVLVPDLALVASVYSEHQLPAEQAVDALRPFNGELAIEDRAADGTYSISGREVFFYTAYWPPSMMISDAPAALGQLEQRKLHHWDLHAGVPLKGAHRDLCNKVASAALALAERAGGVAIDMFGFPFERAEDVGPD
jgi:hypothetical protein